MGLRVLGSRIRLRLGETNLGGSAAMLILTFQRFREKLGICLLISAH